MPASTLVSPRSRRVDTLRGDQSQDGELAVAKGRKPMRRVTFKPDPNEPQLVTALREAIKASGRSHNSIATEASVTPSNIDRFMAGKGITLDTAGRIAAVLSLKLVSTAK